MLNEIIGMVYHKKWATSNLWAAILGVCRYFYLSIAPKLDSSVEIIPSLAWLKEPATRIPRNSILGITDKTNQAGILYTPDQVAVFTHPVTTTKGGKSSTQLGVLVGEYPPIADLSKNGVGVRKSVSLPKWLEPLITSELVSDPARNKGESTKDNKYHKVRQKSQKKKEVDRAEKEANESKIGGAVSDFAKLYFATYSSATRSLQVRVPWTNIDYVNKVGSNVSIPDLSGFSGGSSQELHRLLASVTLQLAVTSSGGRAALALEITHVRDKASNDKFALDEHPFYTFDSDSGNSSDSGVDLGDRLGPSL
jgi:hypothetical protein